MSGASHDQGVNCPAPRCLSKRMEKALPTAMGGTVHWVPYRLTILGSCEASEFFQKESPMKAIVPCVMLKGKKAMKRCTKNRGEKSLHPGRKKRNWLKRLIQLKRPWN